LLPFLQICPSNPGLRGSGDQGIDFRCDGSKSNLATCNLCLHLEQFIQTYKN
jgi:hypothetical protein